jgi:glycosyltransferase involved in cell wall biosynthesis
VIASSDTVLVDMLMEPIRRVLAAVPETRLLVMGLLKESFERAGLSADFHPLCSPEEFSQVLLSIRNGIGLIPLDDSVFSSCKSSIKYYHYSACGIVSIASDVLPYSDAIEHGVTGMLAKNTTEHWEQSILHLMADAGHRRLMLAKAIRSRQKNASPARSVEAWKRVFQNLPKPDERLKRQAESGELP